MSEQEKVVSQSAYSCGPDRSCCYHNSRCLMVLHMVNGKPKLECGCPNSNWPLSSDQK
ncbi:hypothetical protein MXL46_11675 [Heyndrickxia sporothermodurans]|uniref:hypothetical protein n=1 Tax=Heyndrickxia sporothermodurans TaxID=46224 RepID=UPI002DBE07D3|nr:hypothetical protein [Heyndrickxia sporothermodurans]MEB6549745.1 hypothetical protein [Heyndrickxia sporothermodurans]